MKAKLYQGEVSGSAVVPVRAAAAGDVDLRLDGVDVQALAKSLPSMPLRLQGKASGSIQATIPAAGPDGQRQATARSTSAPKSLTVQNIPTDNLHADVDYKAGVAEYHLKGDSLGGHFTLDGKIPFAGDRRPATPAAATALRRTRTSRRRAAASALRASSCPGYREPWAWAPPWASCTAGPTSTCRSSWPGRTTP